MQFLYLYTMGGIWLKTDTVEIIDRPHMFSRELPPTVAAEDPATFLEPLLSENTPSSGSILLSENTPLSGNTLLSGNLT